MKMEQFGGEEKIRQQECTNRLLALAGIVLLMLYVALSFDYYYDLNDDVLMKDILAGAYTGVPEGHNIQMLWPISAAISLLYRILRGLPWYGLFLCGCHYGCLYGLLKRSLSFGQSLCGKIGIAVTFLALTAGFFLQHLVNAQYTVTCTLLGATAAFLFYTTDTETDPRTFLRRNIPSILLVWLAYLIRTEMLLLVLPMICVAGAARWGSERKIFTRENGVKYLSVIGLILLGIGAGQLVHMAAYHSSEWQTFTEFFNNRTELYDFQETPDYAENQAFYESVGISEDEKILLDNYNFGIDEEIDEQLVGEVAAYAGGLKAETTPFFTRLKEALSWYRYRFLHGAGERGSDYPYNYLVILAYVLVFFTALPVKRQQAQEEESRKSRAGRQRQKAAAGKSSFRLPEGVRNGAGAAWKLAFLFLVRSVLWLYILLRGRDPERITHSLYLMELAILAAMLLINLAAVRAGAEAEERHRRCGRYNLCAGLSLVSLLLLGAVVIPSAVQQVRQDQALRAQTNAPYLALYEYFSSEENRDNFYLIDVYSSVSYSEKMFVGVDNSLDNYDIMGGWACKSPLQRKKLAAFGIDNMEDALRQREDVYFVRAVDEDMEWLTAYYESHGTPIAVNRIALVGEIFEIYAVSAAE